MVDENFGFWIISSRPVGPPAHSHGQGPAASAPRQIQRRRQQRNNDDGGSPARTIYGGPAARRATEPWLRWRRPHRRRPENSVLCPPSHSHVWAAAAGIFGSGPFIKPPVPTSRTFISTSTADQQPHTSRRPAAVVQISFVVNRWVAYSFYIIAAANENSNYNDDDDTTILWSNDEERKNKYSIL